MYIVYYVVTAVGTIATDWANDGVFGDGWYLAGIGRSAYEEDAGEYGDAETIINAFVDESGDEDLAAVDAESEDYDPAAAIEAQRLIWQAVADDAEVTYVVQDRKPWQEDETEPMALI